MKRPKTGKFVKSKMENPPGLECWNCQENSCSEKEFALMKKMVLCDECLLKIERVEKSRYTLVSTGFFSNGETRGQD